MAFVFGAAVFALVFRDIPWYLGGLLFAPIAGLARGWAFCIQHWTIRLTLWMTGCAPLRYSRFLDASVDRILLYRGGGAYMFVHGMLRSYFAVMHLMNAEKLPAAKTGSKAAEE